MTLTLEKNSLDQKFLKSRVLSSDYKTAGIVRRSAMTVLPCNLMLNFKYAISKVILNHHGWRFLELLYSLQYNHELVFWLILKLHKGLCFGAQDWDYYMKSCNLTLLPHDSNQHGHIQFFKLRLCLGMMWNCCMFIDMVIASIILESYNYCDGQKHMGTYCKNQVHARVDVHLC